MKLGVVTASYPRFAGDPAGNFVAGHVAALRALGHDVDVIAASTLDAGRLFHRGGAPDALERAPFTTLPAAAVTTARLVAAVARRAHRWDAMFAHWLVPSALAALPTRIPMLAIAHGGDVFTLRRLRLLAPLLAALRHRRAKLAFVASHLRTVAAAAAPSQAAWLTRAAIQPMGLDLARFAALERAPEPLVLVVARLVPIKGVDVALAAARLTRTPFTLAIAGDGPERASLGTSGARWLGTVTADERDALLRRAAAVVIPSRVLPSGRTEGTPMIALEALAAGVPVIASAVGGLVDLPAVRLVPPDDPAALAAAIDHTLAAPPAETTLRASVAHLDWREVTVRLLAQLRE